MDRATRLRFILAVHGPDTPLSSDDLAFVGKYLTCSDPRVAFNYATGQREFRCGDSWHSLASLLRPKRKLDPSED